MAIWQYGNWSKSKPSETSKFQRMKKTIMSIWNAHCIFLSILSSTFPYNALTTKTTKHKISFMLFFILSRKYVIGHLGKQSISTVLIAICMKNFKRYEITNRFWVSWEVAQLSSSILLEVMNKNVNKWHTPMMWIAKWGVDSFLKISNFVSTWNFFYFGFLMIW